MTIHMAELQESISLPISETTNRDKVTVYWGMTLSSFLDEIETPTWLKSIVSRVTPEKAQKILASAQELGTENPKDWTFETLEGEPTGYFH